MSATKVGALRLLEGDPRPGHASPLVIALVVLISLNVLAVILESVEGIHSAYRGWFDVFEVLSLVVFGVEYIIRLWAIPADPRYASPIVGRLRYLVSPMALVDLAAILPSVLLLASVGGVDLRALRIMRFFRLLRVLKLGRYSASAQALAGVVRERRPDLIMAMSIVGIFLILSSSVVYAAEHEAQPQAFASIPHAMWWAVITLTTIGYGDVYPVTTVGKIFGGVTALLGVLVIALPAAILAAGFHEQMARRRDRRNQTCPHCGKDVYAPQGSRRVDVAAPNDVTVEAPPRP